jgi:hypothetical protein
MAIEFLCPSCQGTLSMPDDAAGRLVRCGNCLSTLRVPDAAPTPAYEPPPPPKKPAEPVRDERFDEHGEPRPRRKTKKPSGRSPLFWIVVILLGLGLFTCLACGGGILILATPRWKTHESTNGEFRVDLPAVPNENIGRDAKLQLKPGEKVEGAVLAGRLEFFWVWYAPFEGAWRKVANEEKLIDEVVKHMTQEDKSEVLSSKPRTVDGQPARELAIRQVDNQTYHCLVVVGKTKLYIVAAGGPLMEEQPNPRVRRFLDSFHLK